MSGGGSGEALKRPRVNIRSPTRQRSKYESLVLLGPTSSQILKATTWHVVPYLRCQRPQAWSVESPAGVVPSYFGPFDVAAGSVLPFTKRRGPSLKFIPNNNAICLRILGNQASTNFSTYELVKFAFHSICSSFRPQTQSHKIISLNEHLLLHRT